jgi:hypothetical protein
MRFLARRVGEEWPKSAVGQREWAGVECAVRRLQRKYAAGWPSAADQEQLQIFVAAETEEVATLRTIRIADRLAVLVYLLHQAGASRRLLCIGGAGCESERCRECKDTDGLSVCPIPDSAGCRCNLREP